MYTIYHLLLTFAFIISFPYLWLKAVLGNHGVVERMGRLPKRKTDLLNGREVIWFHAASVGEVKALSTIIPQFKRKRPAYCLVVSTLTKTGKAEAEKTLRDANLFFFPPVDLKPFVCRVLRSLKPTALILVETELWPNLIREAKRSGCFVGLVNGRISERSFRRYRLIRGLIKQTLTQIDLLCLQSEEYKNRMLLLGAQENKTILTGNLKFDRLLLTCGHKAGLQKRDLHIPEHLRVIIAGSTREGEEVKLFPVFKAIKREHDDLIFILAPRHLDRLNQLERLLSDSGMNFVRRTKLDQFISKNHPRGENRLKGISLILLDTMGELSQMYSIADVAFVGGSLVPVGGHNLLEPAICGVPVLFGPHVDNFREEAKLLVESGGGIQIQHEKQLSTKLSELLSDHEQRRSMGRKAQEAIQRKTGIAERTADFVLSALEKSRLNEKSDSTLPLQ